MSVFAVAGAVIIAAVLAVMLRSYKPEYALVISLVVSVGVIALLIPYLKDILRFLESASRAVSGAEERIKRVIKALGVAILTGLAGDLCRDCGEGSMASRVELLGKVTIIVLALPLATELLNLVSGMLRAAG